MKQWWYTGQRTQASNPISLGSPASPCRPRIQILSLPLTGCGDLENLLH
jgi:hypothetical protein